MKARRSATIVAKVALAVLAAIGIVVAVVVTQAEKIHDSRTSSVFLQATASPTISPSSSPSAEPSAYPSLEPTSTPSAVPSMMPSVSSAPSDIPSAYPTAMPSSEPSSAPTSTPTAMPSAAPSSEPSAAPSSSPTAAPSISPAPTFAPIPPDYDFRLKMYWERGYLWQDNPKEKRYCMTCCRCNTLNFGDQGEGCWPSICGVGSQLWLQNCNDGYGEDFIVRKIGKFMLIREQNRNICLTRTKRRFLTFQTCNPADKFQLWQSISANSRFELLPAFQRNSDEEEFCMTQQHHPKSNEIVGLKRCSLARKDDTSYWETY